MTEQLLPHRYSPDWVAMGDCKNCGHVGDDPIHVAPRDDLWRSIKAEAAVGLRAAENCDMKGGRLCGSCAATLVYLARQVNRLAEIDALASQGETQVASIIVNGRTMETAEAYASYEWLVQVAGGRAGDTVTVNYRDGKRGRAPVPGDLVEVRPGMVVNVADTSRA